MAVPAHDERDFAFARAFDLDIAPVIQPKGESQLQGATMTEAYVGPGVMANSGPLDGIEVTDGKGRTNPAIAAAIDWLEENAAGQEAINYRLRDWLISRQRYWGSPIPTIHRADGGIEAVPDADLPVRLPEDVDFDGRSPLPRHPDFSSIEDSSGEMGRRETDTMDTFMCSSWYWLRYLSPHYDSAPFDPEEAAYWLPVDTYTGGAEHAVMHLLYARFFVKAMRDMGLFDDTVQVMLAHGRDPDEVVNEPFSELRNQGQILGEPRQGHHVAVVGERDGERIIASAVKVVADSEASAGADVVVQGELMRRTENVCQIASADGTWVTVEVPEQASVDISSVPGPNSVNQLEQHLDVERMSKSRGNVVNPDELVARYGADTVRTYLMFAFEWQKGGPWNSQGIAGSRRFIEDVWKLGTTDYAPTSPTDDATASLRRATHSAIAKVGGELEAFKWNTAIAALMTLRNECNEARRASSASLAAWNEAVDSLLLLLAPIAPHITEELWRARGNETSVHLQPWPEADDDLLRGLSLAAWPTGLRLSSRSRHAIPIRTWRSPTVRSSAARSSSTTPTAIPSSSTATTTVSALRETPCSTSSSSSATATISTTPPRG